MRDFAEPNGDELPFARRGWQIARTVVAVLALAVGVPLIGQAVNLPSHNEYVTEVGGEQHIVLADGTAIHLNERSWLSITQTPHAYTVRLVQGEAFFDVHHDPNRRLWVMLDNAEVEDIGTQFDVRRAVGEDDVTVSVLQGSVKVLGGGFDAGVKTPSFVVAEAGQEVRVQGAGHQTQIQVQHRSVAELESQRAWVQGWLTFDGEPLAEVLRAVNSRNRRQVIVADPSIAQLPVGGRFLAADLDALVEAITQALPVRVIPSRGPSDHDLIRLAAARRPSMPSIIQQQPDRPRP